MLEVFAPDFELPPDEVQGKVSDRLGLMLVHYHFENNLGAILAQDQILLQDL